eukprot:jgi/Bigna1/80160/fgenesh1_pg.68_\
MTATRNNCRIGTESALGFGRFFSTAEAALPFLEHAANSMKPADSYGVVVEEAPDPESSGDRDLKHFRDSAQDEIEEVEEDGLLSGNYTDPEGLEELSEVIDTYGPAYKMIFHEESDDDAEAKEAKTVNIEEWVDSLGIKRLMSWKE